MISNEEFLALDVETASFRPGSICQIGVARFRLGEIVDSRSWLVRPRYSFNPANIRLHGIGPAAVREAGTWNDIYPELMSFMSGANIVSHTSFDRRSIFAACCSCALPMFSYRYWKDSCSLARSAWPNETSYSLPRLAQRFGIAYRPHDAQEDARVAGMLYIKATRELDSCVGDRKR